MSGHFLFELHHDPAVQNDSNGWTVNVIWNGDPPAMSDDEVICAVGRQLPLNNIYATMSELPVGDLAFLPETNVISC